MTGDTRRRTYHPGCTWICTGALIAAGVAQGLRVQPPAATLGEHRLSRWGVPARIVCDRFRLGELMDAIDKDGRRRYPRLEPRVTRWSDAAAVHPGATAHRHGRAVVSLRAACTSC